MHFLNNAKYVDPIIGTVGDERKSFCHGGGKTYPGACMPGGMVQLSPDTISAGDNTSGYNYCMNTIEGFSFNHMSGVGWYGDLGNVQVMPVVGKTDLRSGTNAEMPFRKGGEGWKSAYRNEMEHARAGYYSVLLDRYDILAEATVSMRTGYLRFTYPASGESGLMFNFSRRIGGHVDFQHVEIVSDTRVEGYLICTPAGGGWGRGLGQIEYNLYFTVEFSKPASAFRFFSDEEYAQEGLSSMEGTDVGLDVRFETEEKEQLVLRCGVSYTDMEGARGNLLAEGIGFDFDGMKDRAEKAWAEALSCIEVEGSDETDRTIFYTCLYHALLDPRVAQDADGRFRTTKGEICREGHIQRTLFSGWDVYRSEFPLLTIIRPDIVNDTINSLIKIARVHGASLPRYELNGVGNTCMVGDPGVIVAADAYIKGIRDFDAEGLYDIAVASAGLAKELNGKPFASKRIEDHVFVERGLDSPDGWRDIYLKEAYEPHGLGTTLELLIADYALSRLARAMGKEQDADFFLARAMRYAENYNPRTGFMGPRDETGAFLPVQDEFDGMGCVEANILQQSLEIPYDVKGLAEMLGRERFISLLEEFFEKADFSALWNIYYNHSNEPCHNVTHYFNYLGLPARTQYWTRRVQKEAYRLGAFGFCGNEDVGQLSGWYVLSALGFAQVSPTDEEYQMNTPLFRSAEIRLDRTYHSCEIADTFTVECDRDPLEYPYIRRLILNGQPIDRLCLTYREITAGGRLDVLLGREPE